MKSECLGFLGRCGKGGQDYSPRPPSPSPSFLLHCPSWGSSVSALDASLAWSMVVASASWEKPCSLGCSWRDTHLLAPLLHALASFLPSAESQPALLLVPHSQQLSGGALSPQQRASPDRERAVAMPAAVQQASPGHRGSRALLWLFQEVGIAGSPRLRGSRPPAPPPPPDSAQTSAELGV